MTYVPDGGNEVAVARYTQSGPSWESGCNLTNSNESSVKAIRYIPDSTDATSTGSTNADSYSRKYPSETGKGTHKQQSRTSRLHPTTLATSRDAYEDEEDECDVKGIPPLLHDTHEVGATRTHRTEETRRSKGDPSNPTDSQSHLACGSLSGWGQTPPSFIQGSLYWGKCMLVKSTGHTASPTTDADAVRERQPHPQPQRVRPPTNVAVSHSSGTLRHAESPTVAGRGEDATEQPWWEDSVELDLCTPVSSLQPDTVSNDDSFGGYTPCSPPRKEQSKQQQQQQTHFSTPSTTREQQMPPPQSSLPLSSKRARLVLPDPAHSRRALEMLLQRDEDEARRGGGRDTQIVFGVGSDAESSQWSCRELDEEREMVATAEGAGVATTRVAITETAALSSLLYEPQVEAPRCKRWELAPPSVTSVRPRSRGGQQEVETGISLPTAISRNEDTRNQNTARNGGRDRRLRYISGIMRLMFVPEAIDLEERDVRRWIRSVNRIRRYEASWAAEQNVRSGRLAEAKQTQIQPQQQQEETQMPQKQRDPCSPSLRPQELRRLHSVSRHQGQGSMTEAPSLHSGLFPLDGLHRGGETPLTFLEMTDRQDSRWDMDDMSSTESSLADPLNPIHGGTPIGMGSRCSETPWGSAFIQAYAMERRSIPPHSATPSSPEGLLLCTPIKQLPPSRIQQQQQHEGDVMQEQQQEEESSRRMSAIYHGTRGGERHNEKENEGRGEGKKSNSDEITPVAVSPLHPESNNGNKTDNRGGNRRKLDSPGDRLAIRIASLKANLVLLATFVPLALFVGLSIFTSAVAVSGLFVVVLAVLLGVVVYRHAVLLYSLCFAAGGGGGSNSGWLLISPSLLDLTQRYGGRPLFLFTSFFYMGALLSAAVLFLSFGYILTGGAVAALRVLQSRPTLDTTPLPAVARSSWGCQLDEEYRIIILLPFFLVAVGAAGPANARSYICWWETGIFRLISVATFGLLFAMTLVMQMRYTVRMSPSKFDISLPFFLVSRLDSGILSLEWLHDTLFNNTFWTPCPVFGYIILRLSLSVAQLSWLFACSLGAVKAGTYHLYLVPLLWRRPTTEAEADKRTTQTEPRRQTATEDEGLAVKQTEGTVNKTGKVEEGMVDDILQNSNTQDSSTQERTPAGDVSDKQTTACFSLSGVFSASGFGGPFSLAYALFLTVALAAIFAAFLGVSMHMPSLAAPLPVRLLWTAVTENSASSSPSTEEKEFVCALGILEGASVGSVRFAAVLSFLAGLVFFAWVPYFIVHVSSMLANLRPGVEPTERQALAASAFLRSKQAAATRGRNSNDNDDNKSNDGADGHCSPNVSDGTDHPNTDTTTFTTLHTADAAPDMHSGKNKSAKNTNLHASSPVSTKRGFWRWGVMRPNTTKRSSVVFDLSSPFMAHPELYLATTRAGDGVRVTELFKHLRHLTLDGNWIGYHVAEVLLLRLPFLLVVAMATAVLIAGRNARCYAFWTFRSTPLPSSSTCADTSTLISDQLYGRLTLFATISGGLCVAPLVFAVPPIVLLRFWWERRRCLRLHPRLATMDVKSEKKATTPTPTTSTTRRRGSGTETVAINTSVRGDFGVPFMRHTANEGLVGRHETDGETVSRRDVLGGVAGVRFFLATQRSAEEAVIPANPSSEDANHGTGGQAGAGGRYLAGPPRWFARTPLLLERHRYETHNAPLPPSQYFREWQKNQKGDTQRLTLSRRVFRKVLLPLFSTVSVTLSLLMALLALVGTWRAIVALSDQYNDHGLE